MSTFSLRKVLMAIGLLSGIHLAMATAGSSSMGSPSDTVIASATDVGQQVPPNYTSIQQDPSTVAVTAEPTSSTVGTERVMALPPVQSTEDITNVNRALSSSPVSKVAIVIHPSLLRDANPATQQKLQTMMQNAQAHSKALVRFSLPQPLNYESALAYDENLEAALRFAEASRTPFDAPPTDDIAHIVTAINASQLPLGERFPLATDHLLVEDEAMINAELLKAMSRVRLVTPDDRTIEVTIDKPHQRIVSRVYDRNHRLLARQAFRTRGLTDQAQAKKAVDLVRSQIQATPVKTAQAAIKK